MTTITTNTIITTNSTITTIITITTIVTMTTSQNVNKHHITLIFNKYLYQQHLEHHCLQLWETSLHIVVSVKVINSMPIKTFQDFSRTCRQPELTDICVSVILWLLSISYRSADHLSRLELIWVQLVLVTYWSVGSKVTDSELKLKHLYRQPPPNGFTFP